jgi:hypothetical protein
MKKLLVATIVVLCLPGLLRICLYNQRYGVVSNPLETLSQSKLPTNPSYPASNALHFLNTLDSPNVVLTNRQSDLINYSKFPWMNVFDARVIPLLSAKDIAEEMNTLKKLNIGYIDTNYYLEPMISQSLLNLVISDPHLSEPLLNPKAVLSSNSAGQQDQIYAIKESKFASKKCFFAHPIDYSPVLIQQTLIFKFANWFIPNGYKRFLIDSVKIGPPSWLTNFVPQNYLIKLDQGGSTLPSSVPYSLPRTFFYKAATIHIKAKGYGILLLYYSVLQKSGIKFYFLSQIVDQNGKFDLRAQIPLSLPHGGHFYVGAPGHRTIEAHIGTTEVCYYN